MRLLKKCFRPGQWLGEVWRSWTKELPKFIYISIWYTSTVSPRMQPERSEACNSASCITFIAQLSKNNWNHDWDRFLWAGCPETAMVDCTYSGYGERVIHMLGTELRIIPDSKWASKLLFLPKRKAIACEIALLWVPNSRSQTRNLPAVASHLSTMDRNSLGRYSAAEHCHGKRSTLLLLR